MLKSISRHRDCGSILAAGVADAHRRASLAMPRSQSGSQPTTTHQARRSQLDRPTTSTGGGATVGSLDEKFLEGIVLPSAEDPMKSPFPNRSTRIAHHAVNRRRFLGTTAAGGAALLTGGLASFFKGNASARTDFSIV